MSEQKNQQKQPPKRATSGIFAILMALLLLILGQQGILPLGDTADAPDALPTATIAAALTDSPTAAPARTEKPTAAPKQTAITAPQDIADYIFAHGTLPDNFLTKSEARQLGWDSSQNYVSDVAPGYSIGGDKFGNYEGLLPDASGRKWYEADANYTAGPRGAERILYSSDGAGVLHERPLPDVYGNAPVGKNKKSDLFRLMDSAGKRSPFNLGDLTIELEKQHMIAQLIRRGSAELGG